jgi:RNA polymerase sigma factor (sigma-70 family)
MMAIGKIGWFRSAAKLPTTRWTTVVTAGQEATPERDKALAELYAMYWAPVYRFIRAKGRSHEEARDLTQGFFTTRLIEKNDIAAVDPARGRFRNWLLTAVKHYLANELAHARAKKRYSGKPIISIDALDAEGRCPVEGRDFVVPGYNVTPERIFERRWALAILDRALRKLQDKHEKRRDGIPFEKLKPLLVHMEDEKYRTIAEELGISEGTFRVTVKRCRDTFQEFIEAEVADTVCCEGDVKDEIRYLRSGLQWR